MKLRFIPRWKQLGTKLPPKKQVFQIQPQNSEKATFTFDLTTYTPEVNMESENTPLEKENHLPNHHFQVPCWSSGVYRGKIRVFLCCSFFSGGIPVPRMIFFQQKILHQVLHRRNILGWNPHCTKHPRRVGGFNPFEKNMLLKFGSNWDHFPQIGMQIKNIFELPFVTICDRTHQVSCWIKPWCKTTIWVATTGKKTANLSLQSEGPFQDKHLGNVDFQHQAPNLSGERLSVKFGRGRGNP